MMAGLTIDNPVTLTLALGSNRIIPGDTLLLRAGTYTADYVFALNNVTIMSYPGERAIINGKVTVNGNGMTFRDLEITYLNWTTRTSQQSGSNPTDIPDKGMAINTPNHKFINCVIHDIPILGLWTPAASVEMNGCPIYNIGWMGPDRAHGHALYTQNALNAATRKKIRHCAMFNCFGYNLHIYGSDGAMSHYDIEQNTLFNGGILADGTTTPWYGIMIGSGVPATDNKMIGNMTYNNASGFLSFGTGGDHYQAVDNYFPDGWVLLGPDGQTTFDVNSGNYLGPVAGNRVFLYANDYDANRANLTIYNQAEANTVTVDVSGLGWTGTVQARNVQDYFSDIQSLTVSGGNITVNMQAINRTVATPVQWTAPITTFPTFGCFVLEKQ